MPFNPNLFNAQPPPEGEVVEGGGGGGTVVIDPQGSAPGNSGGGNSNNAQSSPNNVLVSGEEGSISAPYSSILTFTGFALSASMVGGTVTVVDPYVDAPSGMIVHDDGDKIYNATEILSSTDPPGLNPYHESTSTGQYQLSGSFQFQITNITNATTCNAVLTNTSAGFVFYGFDVTPIDPNLALEFFSFTSFGPTGQSPSPTTNFTSSFILPQQTVYTQQSQSFAQIKLSDLDPATGDVYAIKTAYKPGGSYGNFIDLGLTVLEQQEQLTTGSLPPTVNPIFGASDPSTGLFVNLLDITDNWDAAGVGGMSTPTVAYEPANIMAGAELTPAGAYSAGQAIAFNLKADSDHMPELKKRTKYILEFNHFSTAIFPGTDAGLTETMRLDVYISGSQVTRDAAFIPADLPNTIYQDGGQFGTCIGTISDTTAGFASITANQPYQDTTFEFEADETKEATIYFIVRGGSWTIADISLRTNVETGFTPNFAQLDIRIPPQHLNTPLTFRFEYLDFQNSPAALTSFIYGAVFSGEGFYMQGGSNLLTGSQYIGSGVGSGIEQSGQNSGFIRSIGYNGFTSASAGSGSGFLMFSGSVLPSITSDYSDGGVGLELVQHSGSYFRFRTAGPNAGLEVVTDKFFLGNTNNQFISGSGGKLEISSSNFHLTADGDVTASNALFSGVALANVIRDKTVTVNSSNSSLYTASAAGKTTLYFDGSQGGEQIRSMLIDTDITDPISNMVAPAIGTAKIELIIEIGTDRTVQITDSAFSGPVGPK